MRKPEILAPAGDRERLEYAVAYGADAVYLAGQAFGMRAFAGNFDRAEMAQGVAFAHARGVRVYVTVNTLPHPGEMRQLPGYLEQLAQLGVDGLIVADAGVFALCRRYVPHLPLHMSTQAGIVNAEAAALWQEMGARRAVLARELTLTEIAGIRRQTPGMEMEVFVHGAMCVSFSGRCLLSSYLTGRDANRGACAQPCRWRYALVEETRPGEYFPVEEDGRGTYLYNAKDLCMIDHIAPLAETGVDALKIEGRAKTAYYTACVTAAYRRAVDAWAAGEKLPDWVRQEVDKVSHRPYGTGFYLPEQPPGQHNADAQYIRTWDVCALLDGLGGDAPWFRLKNRFAVGDEMELVQPGRAPVPFRPQRLWEEGGAPLAEAVHPMMRVRVQLPVEAGAYAMLRKRRGG